MRYVTLFVFAWLLATAVSGQGSPEQFTRPIVEEGKRLYRCEMASWHGTDHFLDKFSDQSQIGGYFSYPDGEVYRCVFFSREADPKVIGTVSFDSSYNLGTATTDLSVRAFSKPEADIYAIRKLAMEMVKTDSFFITYNNTNYNFIPLIDGDEKKVYLLTAPTTDGVVLFGNDYLLTFDASNRLLTKKRLHQNLIGIDSDAETEKDGKAIFGTMHTHLQETGPFITATDICTLMLYAKFTKWQVHTVVSKEYLNIWNCSTNTLNVVSMDGVRSIDRDQKKRKRRGRD